jgi:hypothetical protein
MTAKEYISKLKIVDRNFRMLPGPNKVWGIFKKLPRHPDASPEGLVWMGVIPSGRWFSKTPEYDFHDEGGNYHRGWRHCLRLLVGQGHATHSAISKAFGYSWNTKKLSAPVFMSEKGKAQANNHAAKSVEEIRERTSARLREVMA